MFFLASAFNSATDDGDGMEGMVRGLSALMGQGVQERRFGHPVREATEQESQWFSDHPDVWVQDIGGTLVANPHVREIQDPGLRSAVLSMAGAISWVRKHATRWEDIPEPTGLQRSLLAMSGVEGDEFLVRAVAIGLSAASMVEPTPEQRQFIASMQGASEERSVIRSRSRRKDPDDAGEGPED